MTPDRLHIAAVALARQQYARITELEAAIQKTLADNGHLADGDSCTLIELKKVMGL